MLWILLNPVTISASTGTAGANIPRVLKAGDTINDAVTPTAPIEAAGGVLWPASDPTVAAQAALVTARQQGRGINEIDSTVLMFAGALNSVLSQLPTTETIDLPLAFLQEQTSGTEFNLPDGLLPAGAVLTSPIAITVVQELAGAGPVTAATAEVQAGSDAGGTLVGSTDVFGETGTFATPGSNPNPNRGGQQLKMTVTATGGPLSTLTAGHLQVVVTYVAPVSGD